MRKILVCLVLVGTVAHAGILFEPYAGHSVGTLKVDGGAAHPVSGMSAVDSTGHADGFSYGARVAWMFGRFFLGGDYHGVRAKEKLQTVSESRDWTATTIYGVMGLQFFNGLRLTAAKSVRGPNITESTTPDPTELSGSAYKFGIGYRYSIPLAINVEYSVYNLSDVEIGSYRGKVKDIYDTLEYSSVSVNLSFPFEIGGR